MRDVTHTDYAWAANDPSVFDEGFRLTIVTAATVDDVLAGLPSVTATKQGDFARLIDHSYDNVWTSIAGLFQVDDAVVMYEPNGTLDLGRSLRTALSIGRIVLSDNGNPAVAYFEYFCDGSLTTVFEKIFAHSREGTEPDSVLDLMTRIGGFDLDRGPDWEFPDVAHYGTATLALCEAVTGLELKHALLTDSQYLICDFGPEEH